MHIIFNLLCKCKQLNKHRLFKLVSEEFGNFDFLYGVPRCIVYTGKSSSWLHSQIFNTFYLYLNYIFRLIENNFNIVHGLLKVEVTHYDSYILIYVSVQASSRTPILIWTTHLTLQHLGVQARLRTPKLIWTTH